MALIQPKIGFHTGSSGGNLDGITADYIIPVLHGGKDVTIVAADTTAGLYDACVAAKNYQNTTSVLCWRRTDQRKNGGFDFDALANNFSLSPEQNAELHWQAYQQEIPPELVQYKDILELIVLNEIRGQNTNEPVYDDLHIGEYLGRFALHYRTLTDWRLLFFGFAAGEPDVDVWEQPSMLDFLRLCGERPHDTGIALHEYSYTISDILDGYPYKIGRYQFLHDVCDDNGIPRPRIVISEWGWALDDAPAAPQAMADIETVYREYAKHPNIAGGAIWWLGPDFGGVANKIQPLIKPLGEYITATNYDVEIDIPQPPDNGQGGDMAYIWKNAIRHHVQGLDIAAAKIACFQSGKVTGQDGKQYDADKFLGFATMDNDGYLVLQPETNVLSLVEYSPDGDENPNPPVSEKFAIGGRVEITANALNVRAVPSLQGTIVTALPKGSKGTTNDGPTLADNVIWWEVAFDADVTGWCSEAWLEYETASKNPLDGLVLGKPFAVPYALTSPFNAPRSYANGLHEGVDYDVLTAVADSQEPILCLYPGTVDISVDSSGGYGKYVRVRHERNGSTFYTRYAHMDERFVSVGQIVDIGDALGEIGTTGNVTGEHVHINLEVPGYGFSGYVVSDVVDPHPYIGSSPTPPPTGKTYPTTFMRGEPGIWRVVRRVDGSGEDIWELPLMSDSDVRVKNANEGEWYEYRADGVYRLRDTSPAPDSQGKERLYLLSINGVLGGKIAPAVAEVGKTYSYTNEVQFKSKANCQNLSENSGLAPSTFLLKEVLDNYTFPETGFKVDRLYVTVQTGEVQLYAERDGRIIGWCGGGANQDNNVWGGVLGEVYYDRAIPQQEPPRFCS